MRITSDGKVGIGTIAPDANLHVSGNKYNIKLNSTTGSTEDSAFIWGSSSNKIQHGELLTILPVGYGYSMVFQVQTPII